MFKPLLFSLLSLSVAAFSAFAEKNPVVAPNLEKKEAEQIDASLAELNALIRDSRLAPKQGHVAQLEDFREDLQLSENKATLTTDDFARKGGLQETPPATLETEIE